MKTYTFKIKLINVENVDEHPSIISCIHCPLEVFFDSFKASKELYKFCDDNCGDDYLKMYVTISDYLTNDGVYIENDYEFCDMIALLNSNSLKELLTHEKCYGVL